MANCHGKYSGVARNARKCRNERTEQGRTISYENLSRCGVCHMTLENEDRIELIRIHLEKSGKALTVTKNFIEQAKELLRDEERFV